MIKVIARIRARETIRDRDDEGATMLEYGLMVSLIAAVCAGAVATFGTAVQGLFQAINSVL